jgi:hypothetical protein
VAQAESYWLPRAGGDREAAIRMMLDYNDTPSVRQLADQMRKPPGHMYEVAIDADPAKMLDYKTPLSQQSSAVQDYGGHLLSQMQQQGLMRGQGLSDIAGADFPYITKRLKLSPAQVSEDLKGLGVPGLKYEDAGSRFVPEKSHNYVAFSDDIISILRKYGLAGLAPLGAGAAAINSGTDPTSSR